MILLDASGLVAALTGEPAARKVETILRGGEAAIPAPNLAEAMDVLVRVMRNPLEAVKVRLQPLLLAVLPVLPVGEAEASRGAEIRIRHYHRRRSPLSLADCFLVGTAALLNASIATSDEPLAKCAVQESLHVVALEDSTGRRPV
ncbi:MAG: PIN domain-containing protein [Actinomycetota bacterium]